MVLTSKYTGEVTAGLPWFWGGGVQEATALISLAYVSYIFAEVVGSSGIMSLFLCAMTLSHYARHNITRVAAQVTT
eukprot:COSAG01_NODE_1157_length_11476_cov_87.701503_14_plen_75_part_01